MSSDVEDFGYLTDGDLGLVLIERAAANPAKGWVPAYHFAITIHDHEVGRITLRLGTTDFIERFAGHVGYEIDLPHRGHRYAARALELLLMVARAHSISPLWITCNPENVASRRTCELAGAELIEIVDLPVDCDMYAAGDRKKCRYRLTTRTTRTRGPVS